MIPKEFIEAAQIGERDVDLGRHGCIGRWFRDSGRDRNRGQHPHPADDGLGADLIGPCAELDRVTDTSQRVFDEQLQDPRVPASAGRRTVLLFQGGAEGGETDGEFPVAEHRCVVQRRAYGQVSPGSGADRAPSRAVDATARAAR